MRLLLIRHAIAEERGPRWPDDSLRPLTADGRRKMREAAAGIAYLAQPQLILTSPYTRALETAGIVAEAFPGIEVRECDGLAASDHEAWFAAAAESGKDCVAAVGHEPLLSQALSLLLQGDELAIRVEFKKGAAALVECYSAPAPGAATLLWLIQPAGLRAVARTSAN